MRLFYFLFLVLFTGAAGLLAYENQQDIALRVYDREFAMSIPVLVAGAYVAGMLSGWTLVGMLRRSIHSVTSQPYSGELARA